MFIFISSNSSSLKVQCTLSCSKVLVKVFVQSSDIHTPCPFICHTNQKSVFRDVIQIQRQRQCVVQHALMTQLWRRWKWKENKKLSDDLLGWPNDHRQKCLSTFAYKHNWLTYWIHLGSLKMPVVCVSLDDTCLFQLSINQLQAAIIIVNFVFVAAFCPKWMEKQVFVRDSAD